MSKVRAIHQLELSSHCQNSCEYCPAPIQEKWRELGNMKGEVFDRALYWIKHFMKRGTQEEINMFGIGEAFLNPDALYYIRKVLDVYKGLESQVLVGTNGKAMTDQIIYTLKDLGVKTLYLTDHDARDSMKTLKLTRKYGLPVYINRDFVKAPNNWAGQVNWCKEVDYTYICLWLERGRTMVYHDGRITRCCIDASGAGVVGTIFDERVDELEHGEFSLCQTCHHYPTGKIPPLRRGMSMRMNEGLVNNVY